MEILKDGASSIYGSDAVAGVVDNRLIGATDRDVLTAIANPTVDGGGEFYQVSGRLSTVFDRGYLNIAAQIDRQEELRLRDRSYTDCRDPRLTDPVSGQRVDIRHVDGSIACESFGSNSRFFIFRQGTGNFFDPTSLNARLFRPLR